MNPAPEQNQVNDQELDFAQLLAPIRQRWKKFLVVWITLTVLIGVAGLHLTPDYTSSTTIYFQSQGRMIGLDGMSPMLSNFVGGSDVDDQERIIRSRDIAREIIREQGINTLIEGPGQHLPARMFYWQWKLNEDITPYKRGLHASDVDVAPGRFVKAIYDIQMTSPEQYTATDRTGQTAQGTLGQPLEAEHATFTLTYNVVDGTRLTGDERFTLTIEPAQQRVDDFLDKLSLDSGGLATNPTDVVHLDYVSASPFRSHQVLSSLVERYDRLTEQWSEQSNQNISSTLSQHIKDIQAKLDTALAEQARFQTETGVVSYEPQIEEDVEALVEMEVRLRATRMNLDELNKLQESIQSDGKLYLSAFINQPIFEEFLEKLTEVNQEIAALESEYHEDYPPLRQLRASRNNLVNDLAAAVDNYTANISDKVDTLETQIVEMRSQLSNMPDKVKRLVELTRSAEGWEDLLLRLVAEQQRAQLNQDTATIRFHRVDEPSLPLEPSGPSMKLVALLGISVGLLVALAVVTLQGTVKPKAASRPINAPASRPSRYTPAASPKVTNPRPAEPVTTDA